MAGPVSVAPRVDGPPTSRADGGAAHRLWHAFGTARLGAGLLVLVLLALAPAESTGRAAALILGVLYLASALASRLWLALPSGDLNLRWLATVGLDLLTVIGLQLLSGINYTPLFALPVLMAAVLAGPPLAYGTAALASALMVLQASGDAILGAAPEKDLLQALLTGGALFALAVLSHQLALRLWREERRSRQSQEAVRLQAEINALVIQTLADGVLVVDPQGRVQAINPTASALLGRPGPQAGFRLGEQPAWAGLQNLAFEAIAGRAPAPREVRLAPPGAITGRQLRVRTRLATAGGGAPVCVMFLEDLREVEARIRTEKLAAMGRMSAAVAHEIRNPLAAISQANALLAEDLRDPALAPLTALVDQNARRLARIVDDVLDLARARSADPADSPALPLDAAVRAICAEWQGTARDTAGPGGGVLSLALGAEAAQVAFDPEHLRRVLVNLLDNARRHASAGEGAVRVATVATSAGGWQLTVWSDGAPLDPSVQNHLFEPFFSSDSRSSGLGLHICRELCMRHGARIGYQRAPAPEGTEGNAFTIYFLGAGEQPAATISA